MVRTRVRGRVKGVVTLTAVMVMGGVSLSVAPAEAHGAAGASPLVEVDPPAVVATETVRLSAVVPRRLGGHSTATFTANRGLVKRRVVVRSPKGQARAQGRAQLRVTRWAKAPIVLAPRRTVSARGTATCSGSSLVEARECARELARVRAERNLERAKNVVPVFGHWVRAQEDARWRALTKARKKARNANIGKPARQKAFRLAEKRARAKARAKLARR